MDKEHKHHVIEFDIQVLTMRLDSLQKMHDFLNDRCLEMRRELDDGKA